MDASASSTISNLSGVYGFIFEIENSAFQNAVKHKNTVIKYTKLPDFDIDSKVPWMEKKKQAKVRTRRIAVIEESPVFTTRSLKADLLSPHRLPNTNVTKRKIVTIEEDDENDLHPKFTREIRKTSSVRRTSNKSVETEHRSEKQLSQRTTSRLTTSSKYSKDSKLSAKNNIYSKKDCSTHKVNSRNKFLNQPQEATKNLKNEKELVRSRNNKSPSKICVGKSIMSGESDKEFVLKNRDGIKENLKNNNVHKKPPERANNRANQPTKRNDLLKEINKQKPVTIIHVPLDNKYNNKDITLDSHNYESVVKETLDSHNYESVVKDNASRKALMYPIFHEDKSEVDSCIEIDRGFNSRDATTETNFHLITSDKVTQINEDRILCKCERSVSTPTDLVTAFDSLAIPNVTLTKDKSDSKEDIVNFNSKSLPNLQVPLLKVTSLDNTRKSDSAFHNNASYIISHATVTCTTRQKIDFQFVGKNNRQTLSNQSPSLMTYPMNVVSIFKKELKTKDLLDQSIEQNDKSNAACTNCLNELQPLNCSYVVNRNKLVKPSDIISTIRVNTGLVQSDFILCEQFQRELNFIDSFFESLQYLENCSLSDKCFSEKKVKSLFNNTGIDVGISEYGSFLSKLENGANVCDSETMATKSLCLLNLLIRDEQRRAKNLLFVLKMREDALKDFTKSQILWLEKKKKQDNIDISTLKKKQRGALLKLHHECGEMQRMRKALLTQSEKRKVALMKTKKNIELKLKNNVDVDQIILGKKKLKRTITDRSNIAPLKCFELSSSGCEESSGTKSRAEQILPCVFSTVMAATPVNNLLSNVTSVEKSIQTGDSVLDCHSVDLMEPAAEHFVSVDGGYLNILFHNISQPQIFNSGKQYEVNEEALRNILNSADSRHHFNETDVLERFMNQIKNPDLESSSPSTARSLVEELDQYYKGFMPDDKSPVESPVQDSYAIYEVKDMMQADVLHGYGYDTVPSASVGCESTVTLVDSENVLGAQHPCACEVEEYQNKEPVATLPQTGPLPVPVGAVAGVESQAPGLTLWDATKTTNTQDSILTVDPSQNVSLLSTIASPVQCEAEELRRQQLAIEREIKALEEQQCQLMAVREIPDKPPPPYTPPSEPRPHRLSRMYVADETTEEKIQKYIVDPHTESCDPTDPFDTFIKDFCIETLDRQCPERSDKPWETCNLLPPKPEEDTDKLIKKTSNNLLEILTGGPPPPAPNVGARRSDHIDDILFAEWQRCEAEWTSLHTDEVCVKNQIFESIFQKVLTETVDEYKKTVACYRF